MSMPRLRPLLGALTLAVGVSLLSGCAVHGLAFVADKRVKILSPHDQSKVQLPVRVTWSSTIPSTGSLEYAVFIDSHPMRPGQTIDDWIPPTDSCHFTPGCPNKSWLAQRFVFITTARSINLPLVPTLPASGGKSAQNTHHVTIVLFDKHTQRRVGESAFLTTFQVVGRFAQNG